MPRSFPARAEASRRTGKPSQSARATARSIVSSKAPLAMGMPAWFVYGKSCGRMKLRRRSSRLSMPSSLAAASMSRSVMYAASGRPAPRYAETGMVLVNTQRTSWQMLATRYTVPHTRPPANVGTNGPTFEQ